MDSEFVIDGKRIVSLDAFFDEFGRVALSGARWGRNLNAFNDVLRGGFGTPDEGFTLRWSNSEASREMLGYPETARQLEIALERCHPDNRDDLRRQLSDASAGTGPTIFDWLIEIIQIHGTGGEEAEDNVRLILD